MSRYLSINRCPQCDGKLQQLGDKAFCLDCDWDNLPQRTNLPAKSALFGPNGAVDSEDEDIRPLYRRYLARPARNLVGARIVLVPTEMEHTKLDFGRLKS